MDRHADLVDPLLWPILNGAMRPVTSAFASTSPRAVETVTQSLLRMPHSTASSGEISQNASGCSSASHEFQRVIAPVRWCSVNRYVVSTYG